MTNLSHVTFDLIGGGKVSVWAVPGSNRMYSRTNFGRGWTGEVRIDRIDPSRSLEDWAKHYWEIAE